jgi:phage/plasmid-associated DNA primase
MRRILDFDQVLLRDEGSGILLWAMAGFVKLQEEFKQRGDFLLTPAQQARVDSLLAESESLRLFVSERVERHEYGDVTTAEFQQGYAEFCADKGWNPLPITVVERSAADLMLEIFRAPKAHSVERDGKKSHRGWRKVRLKL